MPDFGCRLITASALPSLRPRGAAEGTEILRGDIYGDYRKAFHAMPPDLSLSQSARHCAAEASAAGGPAAGGENMTTRHSDDFLAKCRHRLRERLFPRLRQVRFTFLFMLLLRQEGAAEERSVRLRCPARSPHA